MRIVLSGPPSVGKSTQGRIAAERLGVPHVSSGALIRERAASGDPAAVALLRRVSDGSLAPSDTITAMVLERLGRPDCADGFVLDGFPRKPEEASALLDALGTAGLDAFLVLEASPERLMARVMERSASSGRPDDDPAVFPHRIAVYMGQTTEVARVMAGHDVPVVRVDAEPEWPVVAESVRTALDQLGDSPAPARMAG